LFDYSWAEIFDAVTRLTRDGIVAIKHPGPCLCLPRSHPVNSARRAQAIPVGIPSERITPPCHAAGVRRTLLPGRIQ
jgi:hypothetical protein